MARREPPKLPPQDPRDATIRRLRDDLYVTRRAIIQLMPDDRRALLDAAGHCDTFEDVHAWGRWAADALIGAAAAGADPLLYSGPLRAPCPLCGAEAQTPYERGFSLPEGLRRHLEGTHRSRQCSVFMAAEQLCLDTVRALSDTNGRLSLGPSRRKPWEPTEAVEASGLPASTGGTVLPFRRG